MNTTDLDARLQAAFAEDRPKHVSRVVTRRGTDATGDPAIWIWVILEDETLLRNDRRVEIERIRSWAATVAARVVEDWAYVTFRTEKEQRQVEAGKA